MRQLLSHFRHNLIAYVALFVALGGTSYAAFSLPANSVGTRQIRGHSVTASKLDGRSIGGYVLAWAHVSSTGHVLSGSRGAVAVHAPDQSPATDNYQVGWRGAKVTRRCAPLVTLDASGPLGSRGATAEATFLPGLYIAPHRYTSGAVAVIIANSTNQNVPDSFFIAVIC